MKIEAIRKRLDKAAQGETVGPFEIDIAYLSQDPTFQVRQTLDAGNLERLKSAYKAGKEVAPITVAVITGDADKLLIMDGHHRVTALETIAAEQYRSSFTKPMSVNAMFVKLPAAEARWRAAEANMGHGKPITNKELQKAFQRYVEAGCHRNEDGSYKSYREMGKEFGKTHPTMRTWMIKNFPKEARQMQDADAPTNAGGTGIPAPVVVAKHKAFEAIRSISASFDAGYSHERDDIISALWSLLDDLERVRDRTDAFDHDTAMMHREASEGTGDAEF